MNIKHFGKKNDILFVETEKRITDSESALDLILSIKYETGCNKIILKKSRFSNNFFILSTGLAGEILQKFINYDVKLAIIGDFSKYTSVPLKQFIGESNKGNAIFFLSTIEEAVEKLENCM
ncbi:MAG: DUF4180 domain-containing protein [Christensenellaceae bacterium]|nr:DUF4180 domain-containing protein [Christensenellaceae bacterium]